MEKRLHLLRPPEAPTALGSRLAAFDRGRLVVNVVDMPIKCPVAPLEFCFLADWYFHERGIRDQVQITLRDTARRRVHQADRSQALGGMLAERDIELVTEFNTGEVDGAGGRLVGYDEREVPFDLAVVIPVHGGADLRRRSPGLGDELDFVPTDEHTLQSKATPNVFAIGDAANVPASKAGSVTHFEGETLVENVQRFLARRAARRRPTTGTPTASSRPASTRPCSSTSTTTRAASGPLPDRGRPAAAQGVAAQPPREAHVPVVLLARPAPRPGHPRHRLRPCPPPASTPRRDRLEED